MLCFKSLPQFYTSAEWMKFRKALIAERVNKDDGILYDEHSGKPLLKDCLDEKASIPELPSDANNSTYVLKAINGVLQWIKE